MPRVETVRVNDLLSGSTAHLPAHSEAAAQTESEVRLREVQDLGWFVTREATNFGSPFGGCRKYSRDLWLVPTRRADVHGTIERIVELPEWSRFEDPVTEVLLHKADAENTRAFLVNDEQRSPRGLPTRHLHIFRAPE